MTKKQFLFIRIISAVILAFIFSYSVTIKNYYLPIITILIAMPFLYLLKKQVRDVIADERDYKIAGDSARYTITIYSIIACLAFFVLFALRDVNPYYEVIASVLSYSVCFLLILNSLIFRFYSSMETKKQKISFGIVSIIFVLLILATGLRLFSGEDVWVCDGGQWVKHGNPNFSAPSVECKK